VLFREAGAADDGVESLADHSAAGIKTSGGAMLRMVFRV
jgi:hypothetical protein